MAKKKGHKHHKRSCYTKDQFRNILCTDCIICKPKTPPNFCHEIYRKDPQGFLKDCYQGLRELSNQIMSNPERYSIDQIDKDTFKEVFCKSYICFEDDASSFSPVHECGNLPLCYSDFCEQVGITADDFDGSDNSEEGTADGQIFSIYREPKSKSKKERKAERKALRKEVKKKVVVPYPTFFSSQNAEFQKRIRQILYGEPIDNTGEQNSNKELPSDGAGDSDRKVEDSEPAVCGRGECGPEHVENTRPPLLLRYSAG